ncbi:hypothetical protein TNCV_3475131 [Trichonephila clavipes]|nr:hypothetical protein TNCV_3475131 [Trichonephila clavipes]
MSGGATEAMVNGSMCSGHHDSNCLSDRCLAIVQTDAEAHIEGASCVWRVDIETVLWLHVDNARNHTARLVENFLNADTLQCTEWPACSRPKSYPPCLGLIRMTYSARPLPSLSVRMWRLHFLKNGTVFPKVSPITSSHPCLTVMRQS